MIPAPAPPPPPPPLPSPPRNDHYDDAFSDDEPPSLKRHYGRNGEVNKFSSPCRANNRNFGAENTALTSSKCPGDFLSRVVPHVSYTGYKLLGIRVWARQLRALQQGGADKPQELLKTMRGQS